MCRRSKSPNLPSLRRCLITSLTAVVARGSLSPGSLSLGIPAARSQPGKPTAEASDNDEEDIDFEACFEIFGNNNSDYIGRYS